MGYREDGDEPVSLGACTVVAETEKAIGVKRENDPGTLWVPKSCVHDNSEVHQKTDEGELFVKRWWAEKNELA